MINKLVSVRIKDLETWIEFKEYVIRKHGKLGGFLGEELTNAMRLYLDEVGSFTMDSTHTQNSNLTSGGSKASKKASGRRNQVEELAEKVQVALNEMSAEIGDRPIPLGPGGTLPEKHLERAIARALGVIDRRSIKNRINALASHGYIELDDRFRDPDGILRKRYYKVLKWPSQDALRDGEKSQSMGTTESDLKP
jgi:hypothetical protein